MRLLTAQELVRRFPVGRGGVPGVWWTRSASVPFPSPPGKERNRASPTAAPSCGTAPRETKVSTRQMCGPQRLTGQAPQGAQNQGSESLATNSQRCKLSAFTEPGRAQCRVTQGSLRTGDGPCPGMKNSETDRKHGQLTECCHACCWAYARVPSRFIIPSLLALSPSHLQLFYDPTDV